MAKVTLIEPYASVRGMICKHSNVVNRVYLGQQVVSRRCNKRTTAYSTDELALQQKFKTATANTITRYNQALEADVTAFKAQSKYKTLRGYIFADEYAKL